MMYSKLLALYVYSLLIVLPLKAGYTSNAHSISRREGLSNGAVNSIVKDSEGYMWFGTWNGLNRYDGNSIVPYMPGSNPDAIHNHVIREIYPTSDGPVWMLTNKGLAFYDNVYNTFNSFFTQESEQLNYENDIAICHSDSFGTLASVFGRGVFKYNKNSSEFEMLHFDSLSTRISLTIKRIHQIGNKVYGITANSQLVEISGEKIIDLFHLPLSGTITSSIGITVNRHPCILLTQRTSDALMVDIQARINYKLRIPDDIITSFCQSLNLSRIWAGTEKGRLYSYNLNEPGFQDKGRQSELLLNIPIATRILSIYESTPDILWIGTDGNGVYNLKLTEFPNKQIPSSELSYPIVRSILKTSSGNTLIGTKGGGIDVFDRDGKHLREITVKNGLSNNSVLSFLERSDGSVWIGTDGRGVDILSPDLRSVRNFPRDFKGFREMNFASVYRIIEDSDNRIYLGTSGYGVMMLEFDRTGSANPISCEQLILDKSITEPGQQKQIVYSLTEEKPGIIWIGTRGIGVFRFNTITKRVIKQYSSTSNPGIIRNDDILSLFTDTGGKIWVGSSNGIFIFIPVSSDSVVAAGLKVQTDFSDISIHGIQLDNLGNLWVTTNVGLSLIDPSGKSVRNFNINDGLINFEYSDGASFYDRKTRKLYVGGTTGVDIIQTDRLIFTSYFPPLAFNQLYIRNQPVEIAKDGVLKNRINHQEKLELNYHQDPVSFYISPLAFWGQERYRISYRLVNFDDMWLINPHNQLITYTNLTPGKYFLQVRVSDENGNWSGQIRQIEIIINPPFWLTPWAIAAYIILIIGLQFLIFAAYRKREARKKEAAVQEYKKKKEDELQNYKLEFFTNVAHEFRTPLTLITSHIHALLEENGIVKEKPRLLKVFNNSIKLQKLVLEIMQFRKLEKGKEPLYIQTVKPVILVKEVVSDLEMLAQKGNISCEVHTITPDLEFNTDSDKFQRIVTNLVSNAIKYNISGGYVRIFVSSFDGSLKLEVEDNGIGIRPEYFERLFEPFGISSQRKKGSFPGSRSTGLGLAVTKGLVELLLGTISFESRLDKGTRFTCIFPAMQNLIHDLAEPDQQSERKEFSFIDEPLPLNSIEAHVFSSAKPIILIVDDDPEILKLLGDFLNPDYNIIFAANGKEAFEKVINSKPDLIVSDVMMPEMDGIEFCSRLRGNFDTSHLPLIFLAEKAEIEDRIMGLKAGADSYMPKPFHPEHLKVCIENLLQLRASIIGQFTRKDFNPGNIKEIPDPFFQKLLSFIDENLDDESLSSEKLCDKLAISKSSLYNKTRSVLGVTPHNLIYQRRLSKAAILLKSTVMTVSEIIDYTGFSSRTHFYELFNKAYGVTPSDYRNNKI
jgi:signal transduction histidine kinase/ligand-binding sensor domain-containing protein/CheY-like chemotaxis protein/AraC-like DNA-binding protein